jgi:tetratricopeptide (TPR) repeat protein
MKTIHLLVCLSLLSVARGEAVDALIEKADALDAKNRNAEALAVCLEAEKLEPGNAEILHRIAKQYAQQMTESDGKALGASALDYAQRAVKAGPDNSQAHLSLAIVYGKIAFLKSPRERMEYSHQIKDEAETALRLDPRNDLAWHVLGRWNYEVANLSGPVKFVAESLYGKMPAASNERALGCFQKAVALNPRSVMNQVELGRTLVVLGRKDEARPVLEKALAMPSREKDDDETKDRARKALD